jgi:hypothetical protein
MQMQYELSVGDSPQDILTKVEKFLLDAMDLVEQRDEEFPIIAAYDALVERKMVKGLKRD